MPRSPMVTGRRKKSKRVKSDPESGAKEIARTERALGILDLRRQGWSLEAIGQAQTPPVTRERIRVIIVEYLARCVSESVEETRRIELLRLDELQIAYYEKAISGDMVAIDRVLAIMDRRARLAGLNAPVKAEVGGRDGAPLQIMLAPGDRYL